MRMISPMAMASAIAVPMIALGGLESAKAAPIVPPAMTSSNMTRAGTDCSFTSYSQCAAMASGLDAERYGSPAQDDKYRRWNSRTRGSHTR